MIITKILKVTLSTTCVLGISLYTWEGEWHLAGIFFLLLYYFWSFTHMESKVIAYEKDNLDINEFDFTVYAQHTEELTPYIKGPKYLSFLREMDNFLRRTTKHGSNETKIAYYNEVRDFFYENGYSEFHEDGEY